MSDCEQSLRQSPCPEEIVIQVRPVAQLPGWQPPCTLGIQRPVDAPAEKITQNNPSRQVSKTSPLPLHLRSSPTNPFGIQTVEVPTCRHVPAEHTGRARLHFSRQYLAPDPGLTSVQTRLASHTAPVVPPHSSKTFAVVFGVQELPVVHVQISLMHLRPIVASQMVLLDSPHTAPSLEMTL